MTAIFSPRVTKAQRDAVDHDIHGNIISQASRQNTKRPGWNPPDGYVEPTKYGSPTGRLRHSVPQIQNIPFHTADGNRIKKAFRPQIQVRPDTKRGQRRAPPTSKDVMLPELPVERFQETSCELQKPLLMFLAIHSLTHGQPCRGCSYDVHSETGCSAKRELLISLNLWKGKP